MSPIQVNEIRWIGWFVFRFSLGNDLYTDQPVKGRSLKVNQLVVDQILPIEFRSENDFI